MSNGLVHRKIALDDNSSKNCHFTEKQLSAIWNKNSRTSAAGQAIDFKCAAKIGMVMCIPYPLKSKFSGFHIHGHIYVL